jgi:hypothetical protein
MSNEKADEFLSWRGRLSSPDALPEQRLDDREQSWQRLAGRLERKPARRGAAWWIAAACLLLALLPATRFFHAGPAPATSRMPSRLPVTPAARPSAIVAAPAARTSVIVAAPDYMGTGRPIGMDPGTHPIRTSGNTRHLSNYGEFAAIKSPLETITPGTQDTGWTIAGTAPTIAGTGWTIVAPPMVAANLPPPGTSAKPRANHALRIVYLNELDDRNGSAPSLAIRQPAFLRLGVAAAGAGNAAGDQNPNPLIKINFSSPSH